MIQLFLRVSPMRYYVAIEGKNEYLKDPAGIPVIIDVLRASSTIIAALWNGAEKVIPVEDEKDALELDRKLGAVSIGERGGVRIAGFEYNNSPTQMLQADIKGRTIVMTTTNGTRVMVEGGIIASTLNAGAVAEHIASHDRAYLLASGSPMKSDEDLYAAMLIEMIAARIGSGSNPEEAISLARSEPGFLSLLDGIRHSGSGEKLSRYGYVADIDLICSEVNAFPVLPVYRNGCITCLR